jgi:uncharacterized protein
VAFGTAQKVHDPARKTDALRVISEQVAPARWDDVRPPNETELQATAVLEFAIEEASAKIRTGPPLDDEEDYALPVWAGVLPLEITAAEPIPDPRLAGATEIPEYIRRYRRK